MSSPLITFTGLDAKTNVSWLKSIGTKFTKPDGYRAVEFGILRLPKVGQSRRYPDRETINKITRCVYPGDLAFHLCGRYARMVFDFEWPELCDIIDFSTVGRVQVNSTECDERAILTLQRFSVHIERPVIMQWRGEVFPCVPGIHLLQDRSGGEGIVESSWISPDDLCIKSRSLFGYAGGLNPDNLAMALPKIKRAARGGSFWLDCESGVRTDDWFDQTKVETMVRVLVDAGLGVTENG